MLRTRERTKRTTTACAVDLMLVSRLCSFLTSNQQMQVLYSGVGADSGLVQYSRIAHNQRARPRPMRATESLKSTLPVKSKRIHRCAATAVSKPTTDALMYRTLNSAVPAILD